MTVAGDAITTEEVPAAVSVAAAKALAAEEVLAAAVFAAIEVPRHVAAALVLEKKADFLIEHRVKADLEEEANREVRLHQDVKADFHPIVHREDLKHHETKVSRKEHRDALKVQKLQEKEDHGKVNTFC